MESWPAVVTVCLLVVIGTLAVKLWPRSVPFDQCSDIYQTYAHHPGIHASFIKDYRVNDTLFIDATLLEATDTSAWNMIAKDLNVPPPPEIPAEFKELYARANSFSTFVVEKDSVYSGNQKVFIQDVYIYSRKDKTICVFHNCDEKQTMAIFYKKIKELKKSKTT